MRSPLWLCLLGAALVGCGGAAGVAPAAALRPTAAAAPVPSPPTMAGPPAGYVAPICPEPVAYWPWAHELFPGCAPAPFRGPGVACAGDCPRPCRVDRSGSAEPDNAATFVYSGDGLLHATAGVGEIGHPGLAEVGPAKGERLCTRSGNITRCPTDERGSKHSTAWATHGEGDRIVSVKVEDRLVILDYAGDRVTAIRERDDGYPHEAITTFTYDHRGRLVSAAHPGWSSGSITSYRYFGDGVRPQVVVGDRDRSDSQERTTTTFRRDPDGRPVEITRVVENGVTSPRKTVETYTYDCPAPRPFADALVVARVFRDVACTCREPRCAVRAARDGERWRQGLFDPQTYDPPTAGERAALHAIWRELDVCVWASAARPEGGS